VRQHRDQYYLEVIMKLNIQYKSDMVSTNIDGKRRYVTPEGNSYLSMTTVLAEYGKEGLQKWIDAVGVVEADRIKNKAGQFGTALHNLAEQHILGQPIEFGHNLELKRRFKSVQECIDTRFGDVYALETPLYSDQLKIAGRCDVIGQFDGVNSVIDFKQANNEKRKEWIHSYFYQTSGYGYMFAERTRRIDLIPKQVVIIISPADGILQVFKEPIKPWFIEFLKYLEDIGHETA